MGNKPTDTATNLGNLDTAKDLAKIAVARDNEFQMCKVEEITCTSASLKNHPLFQDMFVSANALTETAGKALLGGAACGLATGMPLVGGAVGFGIAFSSAVCGKKETPGRG